MSFLGIVTEKSKGVRSYIYPFGFRGFTLEYPAGNRFIKVTDYRGTPISGCVVTVLNTGGNYSETTDLLGIANVQIDVAGTKTIKILKDKTNKSFSYTYASEVLTRVVVIQPPLM